MKGFMLNDSGDLVIKNGEIQMVTDNELTVQTVQFVLNTNKGEYFFDFDEGINFKNILGVKEIDESVLKSEIMSALSQVDTSLELDTMDLSFDTSTRKLHVKFTAKTNNGEVVEVSNKWL